MTTLPTWARWAGGADVRPFTVGIEEEVMLLHPESWALHDAVDDVMAAAPASLAGNLQRETHAAVVELSTGIHDTIAGAVVELQDLRGRLRETLDGLGLAGAVAGTHPFAVWEQTSVSSGERQQLVYGSMRELARREPTFALHVHVAVASPEDAVTAVNALRNHLPLLLGLSANSPFWQGRDTGMASARTPLFQAFPRVGIPREFDGYGDYVEAVDVLVRLDAIPDHTFLWWDVRLQPRFGTVEVRIMDAQTTTAQTAALAALVQCLVAMELEGSAIAAAPPEVLAENRFLAARDGAAAQLMDAVAEQRVPVRELADRLVADCAPYGDALGCRAELDAVAALVEAPPAAEQLSLAGGPDGLRGLVSTLSERFV